MSRGHHDLAHWLDTAFFEKGAFITCAQTGDILLGKGGPLTEVETFIASDAFYLKDFFHNRYLCYQPSLWIKASRSEILKAISEYPIETEHTKNFDELYAKDFETLKLVFNESLKKVVLISREEFQVSDTLKARKTFFKRALAFGVGMPYGLWLDGYGVVGSTPELLYQLNENKLTTFALAGTSRLGHEAELLNSPKDRLEHKLVVDDIKEKLGPYFLDIETTPTSVTSYKEMIHLKTNISATLKTDISITALTSSLSPTAALGGYPTEMALNFLQNTQYFKQFPKRYFGSALGVIAKDFKQFVVSIRNIQWSKDSFFIESGGGVLPESKLEKELDEIKLKRDTIKRHYL